MTTCAKRVLDLMKTVELFESAFPNYASQSAYLLGILIDMSCTSDEYHNEINNKLKKLISWQKENLKNESS